jgi:hypothetical protein
MKDWLAQTTLSHRVAKKSRRVDMQCVKCDCNASANAICVPYQNPAAYSLRGYMLMRYVKTFPYAGPMQFLKD